MSYRRDLWEVAASHHGVVTVDSADDAGVPAVELRKLAARGALRRYGQGVYVHRDVPTSDYTEPAIAVELAGESAFLHRESVLDLLGVGQFNPKKIRVGTHRRVRRMLPEWMVLETRPDVANSDVTSYEGILSTTVQRALQDMYSRAPYERWEALLDQASRRGLIDDDETADLRNIGNDGVV